MVIIRVDIDLNTMEKMEEGEVEKQILAFRKLLEDYANGGLDKIRAKMESDPTFFDSNDNCFIDLLDF